MVDGLPFSRFSRISWFIFPQGVGSLSSYDGVIVADAAKIV